MKRVALSVGASAVIPSICWTAGMDLLQRNPGTAFCAALALAAFILVWNYPGFTEAR